MTKSQRDALLAIRHGGFISRSYEFAFRYDHRGFGTRLRQSTVDVLVRKGWINVVEQKGVGMLTRTRYKISDAGIAALDTGDADV